MHLSTDASITQIAVVKLNNSSLAVDDLLANTDLEVVVFNGQLDLICDTLGR